jgi:hypothetical protein
MLPNPIILDAYKCVTSCVDEIALLASRRVRRLEVNKQQGHRLVEYLQVDVQRLTAYTGDCAGVPFV